MKERLDLLLLKRNLADSREKARALIMEGLVLVDGQREDKAGTKVEETADIKVKEGRLPYVSRGGLKLEKALAEFSDADPRDKICMDVGASTGGFTDCLLKNGAAKVYAVDVGHGQFDWGLRNDPRVVCMERCNIRYLTADKLDDSPSFVTVDVSFISLAKVLAPILSLMAPIGDIICLIKPQFEAGREKVGKKGVVRDPKVHAEVIRSLLSYARSIDLPCTALNWSPIKGPEGNIEYLAHFSRGRDAAFVGDDAVKETVCRAHEALD